MSSSRYRSGSSRNRSRSPYSSRGRSRSRSPDRSKLKGKTNTGRVPIPSLGEIERMDGKTRADFIWKVCGNGQYEDVVSIETHLQSKYYSDCLPRVLSLIDRSFAYEQLNKLQEAVNDLEAAEKVYCAIGRPNSNNPRSSRIQVALARISNKRQKYRLALGTQSSFDFRV